VVLNSAVDRPWSQYFCCVVLANRDFVAAHPVAAKRALRAALQTLKELPYGRWREYEPEDTVRFYAPRLHEVGILKSRPHKLIAQGTDRHFLNELKRELKG
jgi:NitT/TauT family transport system substrate-binding protein